MVTDSEFKQAVVTFLQQSGAARRLARRQVVVIAVNADSKYFRLLIRNPWTAPLMMRGLIRRYRPERIALVAPEGEREAGRLTFAVTYAVKDGAGEGRTASDRTTARLLAVARREWDSPTRRVPAPMAQLLGRPWLLLLLLSALAFELTLDLIRITWVTEGRYSWLPMLPSGVASALFALYLLLLIATIVTLWRRSTVGYGLALWLSAAQLVHIYAFHESLFQTAWSLTAPVLIWLCLALLYLDDRLRAVEELA